MRIWKSTDVLEGVSYRLGLCQAADGRRYFKLVPNGVGREASGDIEALTDVVPNDVLRRRNLITISELVRLNDGARFVVDAHGVWFTEAESDQLSDFVSAEEFRWSTIEPPTLPDS